MCKIINFPTKESNGYKNLVALFEMCDTLESCNFYLESVEQLASNGQITVKEMYTLRRIGRTKRLKLAEPKAQKAQKVEKPGTYVYTPEMGQKKPDCQMEASRAYYGKHFFIDTPIEIKGRGIQFIKKYSEKDFTNKTDHRIGWNEYQVTNLAFEKLKEQYTISIKSHLD